MNISILHRRFVSGFFYAIVLTSIVSCQPDDKFVFPEPMEGMKNTKVRTFSTELFLGTANIRWFYIREFEENDGSNFIDYEVYLLGYEADEEFDFDKIAEHYRAHFEAYEHWNEFTQENLEFGFQYSEAIGWKKDKSVFFVYSLALPEEEGKATVSTLYSEKLRPKISQ